MTAESFDPIAGGLVLVLIVGCCAAMAHQLTLRGWSLAATITTAVALAAALAVLTVPVVFR